MTTTPLCFPNGYTISRAKQDAKKLKNAELSHSQVLDQIARENGLGMSWNQAIAHLTELADPKCLSLYDADGDLVTLDITTHYDEVLPSYCQYANDLQPQPSYILLSGGGSVYATTGTQGSTSADIWHKIDQTLDIDPMTTRDQIAEFLEDEDTLASLKAYYRGRTVEWDGNNHVGELTAEGQAALGALESAAADLGSDDIMIPVFLKVVVTVYMFFSLSYLARYFPVYLGSA